MINLEPLPTLLRAAPNAGIEPSWEEKHFDEESRRNTLLPIVTPEAADGALRIHQDARILAGILEEGCAVSHAIAPGRHA